MDLRQFVTTLQCKALDDLSTALRTRKRVSCSGLCASLKAVTISRLFIERNKAMLAVCPGPAEAERLDADLSAILSEEQVVLFPEYDTVPFEARRPHARVVENRLKAFDNLTQNKPVVVVATARSLLMRTIPPQEYVKRTLEIKAGEEHSMESLAEWLVELGFTRTPLIEDIGQFSIRGGILDVFPFLNEYPLRLEFFGDQVESIRQFEVFSQRSIAKVESMRFIPMTELFTKSEDGRSVPAPEGAEWRLPEYVERPAALFDFLSEGAVIYLDEIASLEKTRADFADLLSAASGEGKKGEGILLGPDEAERRLGAFPTVEARAFKKEGDLDFNAAPEPRFGRGEKEFFETFRKMTLEGFSITVCCENAGQQKRFDTLASEQAVPLSTVMGNLEEGFILRSDKRAVFSENSLFNRYQNRIRFRKYKGGAVVRHVSALNPGDFVVHVDHGVGRFLGLERVKVGNTEKDCIKIEYGEKALLSVPVEDLKKVQKYSVGDEGAAPPLNSLGGHTWERAKSKAKAEINKVMHELVELYAAREHGKRPGFQEDTTWQKEFEESFIYDDTPDQARATTELKHDLTRARPMDRLLCGDAGFGKTEVALRAAFKVAESGKQVALLVPTTILAYQHFRSFSERLRDYPFKVRMVSRFVDKEETKEILEKTRVGKVDILIGTHRLLSKDISFYELGLLIIDEEHRFGVKQKEKLKELKSQVDVLSMTATPIPRTLQFSLSGIRDLSLINTPPRNRMPIHTRIEEWDIHLVREAILKERARGGQVYYVHNRVESIQYEADKLAEALPNVTMAVAHGQMTEGQLEEVFVRFLDKKIDVLVCSAIIESGLDIPNVNTIIINAADHFGLSQLYQLRGRVGRSSIQAYAYLLVRSLTGLTDDARKRLKTLEQLTEFGSGFQIAMRDLEIRGAGNLLGVRQHGLLSLIGFEMYQNLIKEAIQEIKEKKRVLKSDPVVRVEARAFIPHTYVQENPLRLEIYQRLSAVASVGEIDEIADELRDRFGPVPPEAEQLLDVIAVKFMAGRLNASAVAVREKALVLEIEQKNLPTPDDWAELLKKMPRDIRIEYQDPISIVIPLSERENPLKSGRKALLSLN